MDGKEVAASLRKQIASEVEALVAAGNRPPHLAAVLVGNDGASQTYVGHKEKCCGEVGFRSTVLRLPEETTEEALLAEIARLNADPDVDGFIVQLPLPKHISEQKVIEAIDPRKDVDGFHPVNTGRMISGLPAYLPATPDGILELLGYYKIETAGKHCVVIGRSNIVGRPDRQSAVAEGLGLHGNALSQPDEESRGGRSRRRHRNRRAGQGRVRHGRHDQAGRGSRRRGYHARAERPDQVGVEIAGRRQVRRGGSQVQLHNAGPGRSRADDDHLADEKYTESGSRGSVRKVTLPGAWYGEE